MTLAITLGHELEQDLGAPLNLESTMVAWQGPAEDAVGKDEVVSIVSASQAGFIEAK